MMRLLNVFAIMTYVFWPFLTFTFAQNLTKFCNADADE